MSEPVYGIHAVEALLARDPDSILRLQVQRGREDRRVAALLALTGQGAVRGGAVLENLPDLVRRWIPGLPAEDGDGEAEAQGSEAQGSEAQRSEAQGSEAAAEAKAQGSEAAAEAKAQPPPPRPVDPDAEPWLVRTAVHMLCRRTHELRLACQRSGACGDAPTTPAADVAQSLDDLFDTGVARAIQLVVKDKDNPALIYRAVQHMHSSLLDATNGEVLAMPPGPKNSNHGLLWQQLMVARATFELAERAGDAMRPFVQECGHELMNGGAVQYESRAPFSKSAVEAACGDGDIAQAGANLESAADAARAALAAMWADDGQQRPDTLKRVSDDLARRMVLWCCASSTSDERCRLYVDNHIARHNVRSRAPPRRTSSAAAPHRLMTTSARPS